MILEIVHMCMCVNIMSQHMSIYYTLLLYYLEFTSHDPMLPPSDIGRSNLSPARLPSGKIWMSLFSGVECGAVIRDDLAELLSPENASTGDHHCPIKMARNWDFQ